MAERSAALTTLHRTFFAFFKAAARHTGQRLFCVLQQEIPMRIKTISTVQQ
jgi:hypothetical protein